MSKRKKQRNAKSGDKTSERVKLANYCSYSPESVQPIRIEPTTEDRVQRCKQNSFWERQLTLSKVLNWVTGIAGLFAAIYALIALLQWQQARDAMRADQRPWVTVSGMTLNLKVGEPMSAKADLLNTGKTPASKVQIDYSLKTSQSEVDIAQYANSPSRDAPSIAPRVGVLTPNVPYPLRVSVGERYMASAHFLDLVKTRKEFIYLFGKIQYRDPFGMWHFTTFCGDWNQDVGAFQPCLGDYEDAN